MGALRPHIDGCGGYRERLPPEAGGRDPAAGHRGFHGGAAPACAGIQGYALHRTHARGACRHYQFRAEMGAVVRGDEAQSGALRLCRKGRRSGQNERRGGQFREHSPLDPGLRLRKTRHRERGYIDTGTSAGPPCVLPGDPFRHRLHPRADGDGSTQPAAHRGPRGRGSVPQGTEGFERDAAQAQSHQQREYLRLRPRDARLYGGIGGKRGALARAGHFTFEHRTHHPARCHAAAGLYALPLQGHPRKPDGLSGEHALQYLAYERGDFRAAGDERTDWQGTFPRGSLRYRAARRDEGLERTYRL